ncbi:MAG: ABC transporter ATP-binding protein, partial [Dehalococcoidia bacterium]
MRPSGGNGSEPVRPPQQSGPGGMRWGSFGQPTEKSRDFGATARRLLRRLQRERVPVAIAIVMTVLSVAMSVYLPRVLGDATDVVVDGVFSDTDVDFGHLGRIIAFASVLLVGSWALQYAMSYILAGVVQRTMYGLRADVEDKLNRLPLGHVDRAPRGDLLSRVTNDIDNLSQSLQQTISQIFTSLLTLLGVAIMMFTISPLLALVALTT